MATVVIQVNGKKRSSIEVPANISEEELRRTVGAELSNTPFALGGGEKILVVTRPGSTIPKLVNIIKG